MKASTTILAAAVIACFASFASAQIRFNSGDVNVSLGGGRGVSVQTPKFGFSTGGSVSFGRPRGTTQFFPGGTTTRTYTWRSGPQVIGGCGTHPPRIVFDDPRDPRGNDPRDDDRRGRGRGRGGREVASSEYSRLLGLEVKETRDGLEVTSIDRRSPAEDADLREGDVIIGIGRSSIRDLADLEDAVDSARGTVTIIVSDGREEFELEIGL